MTSDVSGEIGTARSVAEALGCSPGDVGMTPDEMAEARRSMRGALVVAEQPANGDTVTSDVSGEIREQGHAVWPMSERWSDEFDGPPTAAQFYRAKAAVLGAKARMYEDWVRENHPDCPLLAENIVASSDAERGQSGRTETSDD